MICTDMIADEMNRTDVGINFYMNRFQKGDAFLLPLAFITVPIDLARTGVTGGKEIQSPGALVFMLTPVRNVLWLVGLGRSSHAWIGPSHRGAVGVYRDRSAWRLSHRTPYSLVAWDEATDHGAAAGASTSPSRHCATNRLTHLRTAPRWMPISLAT